MARRLPIAKRNPDGTVDFWAVTPTANIAADNRRGRSYARALIREMSETQFPFTLGHVVSAIAGRPLNAVEIGFFGAIGWETLEPWAGPPSALQCAPNSEQPSPAELGEILA